MPRDLLADSGQAPFLHNPALAKPVLEPLDLLDMTRWRPRPRRRGEVGYYTLRRWLPAGGRRAHELLRRVKRDRDAGVLDAAAGEIALFAGARWPDGLAAVTSVACGHSGGGCFGQRLAILAAARLGLRHVEAFRARHRRGTSHPRRNAGLPQLELVEVPPSPVLLVDDIATSGWHIEEAALALTGAEVRCCPVVWLDRARRQ